ncbi:DEAD/DEAH box helicase [Bradyrhizobium jicamae]|uniref:DEAD/DEAH box helicase n=1 Tax=Bradyrhizobium jicamae TaxID=280332 RepID=A0A0R3L7M4_9BRAD|nr:DEAD/DEAH box helicase [Bradyrhizobium jicamae]KRR03924.1 DEAD/DEAH box helicase [Bradyrhizobium jicamae]
MPSAEALRLAREVRQAQAPVGLTPAQAKLYSQRIRREMEREGLRSFAPGDVYVYLEDAAFLLDCAFLERDSDALSSWREGVKRAAEILEWLSQPSLRPSGSPLHLLSAAAYQVAGYPAMALGELQRVPVDEEASKVLLHFLRADFPSTLEAIQVFWRAQMQGGIEPRSAIAEFSLEAVRHSIMAIGSVCSYFRTGQSQLVARSVAKMENLAKGFVHSRDDYSYILARLVAETCKRYVDTTLWPKIELLARSTPRASEALIQFARSAFSNKRALVWPAQSNGIDRLAEGSSFVLCTPTGSGKTTIATLGIVQALFTPDPNPVLGLEAWDPGSLILYLVPSRALAAEVESRMEQDLRGISADPVVVTGLYGGTDWGPTDAWIQSDRRTIVICTFEKADALIRYLGVLFLHRVRLVVIDEVHMVEQSDARGLDDASSRPYRLEQLGTRLLTAQETHRFRIIALSAVAARAAPALARWLSASPTATPTRSDYRSTRQMLGYVEVSHAGNFEIRYDLMDGRSLRFDDERPRDTPFVTSPFPPLPGGLDQDDGPEKRMRAPTLWAALHLAAARPDGSRPTVLISLTQSPDAFGAACLSALDSWQGIQLPDYGGPDLTNDLWTRCLASAEDYFTRSSIEYRLLLKGIALHHGKMPGMMARRLKRLIDASLVRVVVATSTLSEGVNIPVNYLLIPSVYRGPTRFTLQEFTNLIGRAGRPGVAAEGHALVVLEGQRFGRWGAPLHNRQREGYGQLVADLEESLAAPPQGQPSDRASSALVKLMELLYGAWRTVAPSGTPDQFYTWLEQVSIASDDDRAPERYVDSLDSFLIAAIQEVEEISGRELSPVELEAELLRIWRHTYAFASASNEETLRAVWLWRGRVIKQRYPNAAQRRQIYKTSLSPSSATSLIGAIERIRQKLLEGTSYAGSTTEQKFTFVAEVLALLSDIRPFQISTKMGRAKSFRDWRGVLRWWLAKGTLSRQPTPAQITNWYEFVASNFIYRGVWGVGSALGLLLDLTPDGQPIRALEINDWPRSGLPWIAFWLKELITWGTLEPVAAFLLARGQINTRPEAEALAQVYYASLPVGLPANDRLDPRRIRDWVETMRRPVERRAEPNSIRVGAQLVRPVRDYLQSRMVVFPIRQGEFTVWIDPAGYTVAWSANGGQDDFALPDFQYELDVAASAVNGERYLRYL